MLGPEFRELDSALIAYLSEITEKVIREEVHKKPAKPTKSTSRRGSGDDALAFVLLLIELAEGTVIADRVGETPYVFLAGLHRAERTVAEQLMRLSAPNLSLPRNLKHR